MEANLKFLEPYQDEIVKLQTVVRCFTSRLGGVGIPSAVPCPNS